MAETAGDTLSVPRGMRVVDAEVLPADEESREAALDGAAIRAALARGNVSQAAKALGVSRQALYRLMKKHGGGGAVT